MAKVQSTNHRLVLICMNFGAKYIFNFHIVCIVSCQNITVQLSALCAVLYIEQVCLLCCVLSRFVSTSSGNVKLIINYRYSLHNNSEDCSSHLLYGKSLKSRLRNRLYNGHNQSEIVPENNGGLSCDRHVACS